MRNQTLILYPYANEPDDATGTVVRELASMLGSANVVMLTARSRRTRDTWLYLWSAVAAGLKHHRRLRAVIAVDVPGGIRLAGLPARWLSLGRVRVVSWVLDFYTEQGLRRWTGLLPRLRVRAFFDRVGLALSDRIVVVGQCMMMPLSPRARRKATVIPLWRDIIPEAVTSLRNEMEIDASQLVFLYSGAAGHNHPLGALLDAFSSFEGDRAPLLLLAARGDEMELASARLTERPAPNIRIIDRVPGERLSALYATADVHIAILAESMTGTCVPSKAYASMAAAKPCLFLGSEECQVSIDIATAGGGMTVGTTDVQGVIEAIRLYHERREIAAEQGARAREFMSQERSGQLARVRWLGQLGYEQSTLSA